MTTILRASSFRRFIRANGRRVRWFKALLEAENDPVINRYSRSTEPDAGQQDRLLVEQTVPADVRAVFSSSETEVMDEQFGLFPAGSTTVATMPDELPLARLDRLVDLDSEWLTRTRCTRGKNDGLPKQPAVRLKFVQGVCNNQLVTFSPTDYGVGADGATVVWTPPAHHAPPDHASASNNSTDAGLAFDGNPGTVWDSGVGSAILFWDYGAPVLAHEFDWANGGGAASRPDAWVLSASADGVAYTQLAAADDYHFAWSGGATDVQRVYLPTNATAYRFWRFTVTETTDDPPDEDTDTPGGNVMISEVALLSGRNPDSDTVYAIEYTYHPTWVAMGERDCGSGVDGGGTPLPMVQLLKLCEGRNFYNADS